MHDSWVTTPPTLCQYILPTLNLINIKTSTLDLTLLCYVSFVSLASLCSALLMIEVKRCLIRVAVSLKLSLPVSWQDFVKFLDRLLSRDSNSTLVSKLLIKADNLNEVQPRYTCVEIGYVLYLPSKSRESTVVYCWKLALIRLKLIIILSDWLLSS